MSDGDVPRALSPDEVELLKKYRDLAMPAARLAGLDDFAKWLFTSITVIGALGAAFSTAALKTFNTCSAASFFAAIFLTGLSLFLAVCLRAVEPSHANWQSLQDMLKADERALRAKQKLATASGTAFALAVLAAGTAPLASLLCHPPVQNGLSYSFGKDGIKASANFSVAPRTVSEIRIVSQEPSKETVVAAQRAAADGDGTVRLEVSGAVPSTSNAVLILVACDAIKGSQQSITVVLSQKPGTTSSVDKITGQGCLK